MLVPVEPPFCQQCGTPAVAIESYCARCRREEHSFDFARSAVLFTETAREIVHHLKYFDRVSLARPLGELLRDTFRRERFTAETIVPVPLHPARQRSRGFNQAELIASYIGGRMEKRLVRRRKKTASQTGLSRSQRKDNLASAFEACGDVRGRTLVLVDDVYTTGSTVNEIAKTLKRAGASRVEVLTVARVSDDFQTTDTLTATESVSSQ
jgi:competence protein ComFC